VITGRLRLTAVAVAVGAVVAATTAGSAAMAGDGRDTFRNSVRAQLSGLNEDPLALSTTGKGSFKGQLNEETDVITWELHYEALEGSVLQAHIHIGGPRQSGGISVFFCTNLGNGPAGTQACPPAPATITGTFAAADVIGPVGQGVTAGQFDELVTAMKAGVTYVNVHSTLYPGGEIRNQISHHH